MTSQIIRLDVGGTVYRASKSLLETFPDSMLARLVSDTWNNPGTTEIFIDRDGIRFAQVLDFLRDPELVTLTPVLCRELDYFGLPWAPAAAPCGSIIPPGLRKRAVQAGLWMLEAMGPWHFHQSLCSFPLGDAVCSFKMINNNNEPNPKANELASMSYFLSAEELSQIWLQEFGFRCMCVKRLIESADGGEISFQIRYTPQQEQE